MLNRWVNSSDKKNPLWLPFLQYETEVVSCVPVTKKVEVHGKKVTVNGCEVVCKDTVLFPEVGRIVLYRGKITLSYLRAEAKTRTMEPSMM